jgi:hypothetical protein
MAHFKDVKDWSCPVCQTDLRNVAVLSTKSEEVLASGDRFLKWLDAPRTFSVPGEPHSYLNKLALVLSHRTTFGGTC